MRSNEMDIKLNYNFSISKKKKNIFLDSDRVRGQVGQDIFGQTQ